MLKTITIFQNCQWAVEDVQQNGEVAGRIVNIIDQDTGDIHQFPLAIESAKRLGQELMGIGAVTLANGAVDLEAEARRAAERSKK